MKSSWDVEGDNEDNDWFGDTTINRGGTEKTEQEGDEGTAIVAATMEEESEDIKVGVKMKGRLLLLSGRNK